MAIYNYLVLLCVRQRRLFRLPAMQCNDCCSFPMYTFLLLDDKWADSRVTEEKGDPKLPRVARIISLLAYTFFRRQKPRSESSRPRCARVFVCVSVKVSLGASLRDTVAWHTSPPLADHRGPKYAAKPHRRLLWGNLKMPWEPPFILWIVRHM